MNREDIIRMAREAGLLPILNEDAFQKWEWEKTNKVLERFAALVRDYLLSTEIHSCHADCQRFACVQTRKAVEAEREACAKLCEDKAAKYTERAERTVEVRDINPEWARVATQACGHVAAAIRARGQT